MNVNIILIALVALLSGAEAATCYNMCLLNRGKGENAAQQAHRCKQHCITQKMMHEL
jgi:hypothetical protein